MSSLNAAWERVVPHYALTAQLVPPPASDWDVLVHFAGTFDGYVIKPTALEEFCDRARREFDADGRLPEGLTMLRTALFGEQRRDYWGGGYGLDKATLRYVHALVERIRELVMSGANIAPAPWAPGGVADKVMNAYDRLLVGYASWGGHRFHGWTNYKDTHNFLGTVIWSERDCGLRLAFELEREWPGAVHMEFAIGKATRADFDPTAERAQRVDVAVSDLSSFIEDATSQERYRTHRHEAFFEVKWLLKGWRGESFEMDARKRVEAVAADLAKLARHAKLGRCVVAAMVVFDDESYFQEHSDTDRWPADVWRLVVGPEALQRRGLLPETFE
jgi:hypothetical protein